MGRSWQIRPRRLAWIVAYLGVVLLVGCSQQPHAPPLEDGPEFRDAQAGFRFLVPERWTQFAHAAVPPGRLDDERMIVEYKLLAAAKPASFVVTCVDLDDSAKIDEYVASHVPGRAAWRRSGPPQRTEIHGVPAIRLTFTGRPLGPDQFTREVVAIRRGQRVYLFTGIFAASDKEAQEQVHQAVDSILW